MPQDPFDGPEFQADVNRVLSGEAAAPSPAAPPAPTAPATEPTSSGAPTEPASGQPAPSATGTTPGEPGTPQTIPYDRFKEKVDEVNGLKPLAPYAEAVKLFQQLNIPPDQLIQTVQQLQQQPAPAPPPAAPEAPVFNPDPDARFSEWLEAECDTLGLTTEDLTPQEIFNAKNTWRAYDRDTVAQHQAAAQEQQAQAQAQAEQQAAWATEFRETQAAFPAFQDPTLSQALTALWQSSDTLSFRECAEQLTQKMQLLSRNAAVDEAISRQNAADQARPDLTGGAPPQVAQSFDFKNATEDDFEKYAREQAQLIERGAR